MSTGTRDQLLFIIIWLGIVWLCTVIGSQPNRKPADWEMDYGHYAIGD